MGLLSRIINYHGGEKIYNKEYVDELLALKQDNLTFDDTPTLDSQNPVTSDGIRKALDEKIDKASIEDHPTEEGVDKVVSSAGIWAAFQLVNAPVGETMFWPVSECVDESPWQSGKETARGAVDSWWRLSRGLGYRARV